jgi:hypothetical protein
MQTRTGVHSSYVFPAIVFLLVAQPVLGTITNTASEILVIPLTITLVGGVWSLDRGGFWFRVALGLGFLGLMTAAAYALSSNRVLMVTGVGFMIALGVLCVVLGIGWLFFSPRVTVESLLGAMSIYLLIAITFGLLHVGLFVWDPTWYHGVSPDGQSAEVAEIIYFSIGTLTSTAYGDVVPAHPLSRLVSSIEAVVGQMYVALLVAMLASGYAAARGGPGGGEELPG